VEDFLAPAQDLLPELTLDDLRLGGSGIRAKLHPPDQSFADFMIGRDAHCPTLIQVSGIESPGLTSCLSIARDVADLIDATL
jgi:L-2-hydroxyglutarate oxidase LhgO